MRPVNGNAKWVQNHRKWAKTKKAWSDSTHVACRKRDARDVVPYSPFLQVNLKKSMKMFAKKYPKAASQVTSVREMQAKSCSLFEMTTVDHSMLIIVEVSHS